MSAALRRVRTLRLRSADDHLNRRGAILIEDALRTASLPDAGCSRLVLIRRLALGRIRATDPPSAVALQLESRVRALALSPVHAASTAAPGAEAVYFDDDAEPRAALALRVARGEDVTAWYWHAAVPEWTPAMPRDDALRALLAGALASSAGPAAGLALVSRLVRHDALAPLAAALRWQDGPALMRAFGWTLPAVALFAPAQLLSETRVYPREVPSPTLVRMAAPWLTVWGDEARAVWLACVLQCLDRPWRAAQPDLAQRAVAWLAAIGAPTVVAQGIEPPVDAPPRRPPHDLGEAAAAVASDPVPRRARLFTDRAGLFLLVGALERLGMARWLVEHPDAAEWSLPALVLQAVAKRLGTRDGDPVLRALGELPDQPPDHIRRMAHDWARWLRRDARRTARMALRHLVCRPGRIGFTETHIDVAFRFDRADVRVRRAGLDIDPGWRPWLGRVIRFHYLDREAYDA